MKKLLVANRGEIAVRILKTAQKMGLQTVAVFSEADRNAPHVRLADESVCIGPAPSNKSYLKIETIIKVAKNLNVDAIHPGYGFLSENANFAKAVTDAGILFVGPGIEAITMMGSKLAAKEAVKKYNIPMVPGVDEAITDTKLGCKIAKEIGYPILIKASAGGGGKGMRIVQNDSEMASQMERAISEATSAFGDGSIFIEKYIASPRHIEIQILADTHGSTVHLFERECSIQRRHQKVVEEAPSAVLSPVLREKMGAAAIAVAQSCKYVGAGTVEFLLDEQHNFYFLEMNTRLQVEHPVTELITGLDLVEEQLKIANGEPLSFSQTDLKIKGHALELRVYAENPFTDFLPSVGRLTRYKIPAGEGIRVDNGFEEGMEVPIYYDPMLAKLITYGATREAAIQKMIYAIQHFEVTGVATTLPFGRFVCEHEAFQSGDFDTHFVKNHFTKQAIQQTAKTNEELAACIALHLYLTDKKQLRLPIQHSYER